MKEEMKELFKGSWRLTRIAIEGLRISPKEAEAMAVGEMVQQFGKKILTDYKHLIKEVEREDYKQFELELCILPVDELTTLRSRVKELEEKLERYFCPGCGNLFADGKGNCIECNPPIQQVQEY